MTSRLLKIFFIFIFIFLLLNKSIWFDINSLLPVKSYVVDQVWVLDESQTNLLEKQIQDIRDKYTAEILLVIIKTTDWQDISQLWTEIWQKIWVWKSDKDNWIVILIAIEDRAWNISTWYWVEWVLPDLLTKKIWEKNFLLFKEQKYFDWISLTLSDIKKALDWDESIISLQKNSQEEIPQSIIIIFFISVILSFFLLKPLLKKWEYKKVLYYILFAYLITLPIVYLAVWFFSILVNIFIWVIWPILWIFWKAWRWWTGSSGWWSSGGWGFWGFGWGWFGWWWSSWKW